MPEKPNKPAPPSPAFSWLSFALIIGLLLIAYLAFRPGGFFGGPPMKYLTVPSRRRSLPATFKM